MAPMSTEQQQLEVGIQALESQRSLLGDAVVDASLAGLRAKLAARRGANPPAPAESVRVFRFDSLSLWERVGVRVDEQSHCLCADPHPNPLPQAGEGGKHRTEKLPAAEPVHTLKQVSILFLDVGFTALSQHRDPEAVSAVLDDALSRGTAVVQAHRGRVLQYAGDNTIQPRDRGGVGCRIATHR